MGSAQIKEIVDGTVNKHFVTIYSKSYCPHCKNAKKLFESLDLSGNDKPFIIELDEVDDGSDQQDYLEELTGQRSVPNIFINAKSIGGNDKLQALNKSGQLKKLLAH